jgi:pimeloyl-ACP methyl ester carboxylesterase
VLYGCVVASEMVNGALLHYEEYGSGPPLLLVHGTGTYADIWSPVLDGLARPTASSPMTGVASHAPRPQPTEGSHNTPATPRRCWMPSMLRRRPWLAGAVAA